MINERRYKSRPLVSAGRLFSRRSPLQPKALDAMRSSRNFGKEQRVTLAHLRENNGHRRRQKQEDR